MDKYISTKEVALFLDRTVRSVALMVGNKEITPINKHKDFYLFSSKKIKKFKENTLNKDGKKRFK